MVFVGMYAFMDASGLHVNLQKSIVSPIRCDHVALDDLLHIFCGGRSSFLMRYLGLPITIKWIRQVQLQFILDRICARLAGFNGRLMSAARRHALVRSVIHAMPTFALTFL